LLALYGIWVGDCVGESDPCGGEEGICPLRLSGGSMVLDLEEETALIWCSRCDPVRELKVNRQINMQ
jgi:hypothetical protein